MEKITTSLKGKITAENVQQIRRDLAASLSKGDNISICCRAVDKTDLAGFNALVIAHMAAARANKELQYVNCYEPKLADFISQTQFGHVFIS
ncbi:MAG: STAS domain-containing protein [Bacteroidota bacterium]